ncbi:ABC transporter permease [Natranaerobius thermophilus]|uniref:Inner-membrane translocator n=1 Tax=Natranaerobius thermophilus (strain ATCC BAA-1301 / DSM 18059 / JW/NM-WN-LF) TaxID=457570 RepID=B2A5S6_NATTJ|nr:ABC transporter permease [Natranaerobius thermophilus]ACB84019.1 inner-membrane translocator [Natranaerobius thermophilus JW/NM-WN-LF]
MELLGEIFNIPILIASFRLATPLLLAALGGIFSERSGVINIALEGMMLFGAFAAVYGTALTGSPWIGMIYGIIAGMLLAALHALVSVQFKADQIISATGINIFATGITLFLLQVIFEVSGTSPGVPRFPAWVLFDVIRFPPTTYFALILVPITWILFFKTPWGLRIRAIGEHPEAADTLGVNVNMWRFICVVISGALAGLAGAHLSLGVTGSFVREMTAGRGFIALAAMIFGKWNPFGALGAALLFGFADAIAIRVDIPYIPSELIGAIPYVVTIIVLAGLIGRATPPRAVGKPYYKGGK